MEPRPCAGRHLPNFDIGYKIWISVHEADVATIAKKSGASNKPLATVLQLRFKSVNENENATAERFSASTYDPKSLLPSGYV